jgi:hypothetical protein
VKFFEDPVIAEAIVDRLIHPFQKITLKGERSYREKMKESASGVCKKPLVASLRSGGLLN